MNYLIYDSALNGLYTLLHLQHQYPVYRCLFKGTKDESLSDVAPYIFLINKDDEKLKSDPDISLKEVLLVDSNMPLELMVSHFREFIYQKVRGRECYFRFWDARVLKKFLPTCNDIQLNFFFRNINSIMLADDAANTLHYQVQRSVLNTKKSPASPAWPFVVSSVKDLATVG